MAYESSMTLHFNVLNFFLFYYAGFALSYWSYWVVRSLYIFWTFIYSDSSFCFIYFFLLAALLWTFIVMQSADNKFSQLLFFLKGLFLFVLYFWKRFSLDYNFILKTTFLYWKWFLFLSYKICQFSSCLFSFWNNVCFVFNHFVFLYVMCSFFLGTFKILSLIWFSVLWI